MSIFDKNWLYIAKQRPTLYGWLLESENAGFFEDYSDNDSVISELSGVGDDDEKQPYLPRKKNKTRFRFMQVNQPKPQQKKPPKVPELLKKKPLKPPKVPDDWKQRLERSKSVQVLSDWQKDAIEWYKSSNNMPFTANHVSTTYGIDYNVVEGFVRDRFPPKVGNKPPELNILSNDEQKGDLMVRLKNPDFQGFTKALMGDLQALKPNQKPKLKSAKKRKLKKRALSVVEKNVQKVKNVQSGFNHPKGGVGIKDGGDDEGVNFNQPLQTKTSNQVIKDMQSQAQERHQRKMSALGLKPVNESMDQTIARKWGGTNIENSPSPTPLADEGWDSSSSY